MRFRTDDATRWGTGKGANLTAPEVDENFWELLSRVVTLETGGATPNSISNITVTGSQMTIWLEDGTALGPYTLPTAMIRYRGDWVAGAAYAELDLVAVPAAGIYLVLRDHAAAAAFDASATDADGNLLYRWLFPMGQNGAATFLELTDTPAAYGAAGQLAAVNGTGDGLAFIDPPSGGGAGALDDLSDVALATPATAEFLRYDGTAWVNEALAWADIPDKPATFPPSAHGHPWSEITSRPATIDALPAAVGTDGQVLKASAGAIVWGADEGGGGASVSDEGALVLAAPADLNFAGAGVSVADDLDGTLTITIPGGGSTSVSDAGVQVLAGPSDINFAGAGVSVADDGDGTVTVSIAAGSAGALDDLSDVTITAPATAQFLRYDGAAWINAAVAWADIPDKPATFPPSAHTHPWSDVTGRPATIDALPATVGAANEIMKVEADGSIAWALGEGGISDAPIDGQLYGRQDGAWSAIDLPEPEGAYRYWRLILTSEAQDSDTTIVSLGEIEFRSTAGMEETAAGGALVHSGWSNPERVFDGVKSTTSNIGASASEPYTGKYIGYDFGTPRSVEEVGVYSAHNLAVRAPIRFAIEGSDDGATWVELARVDPIDPDWGSGFGTVSRTVPVVIPLPDVDWSQLINKPATVDALPAAVGSDGQVLTASAGSVVWGSGGGGGAGGAWQHIESRVISAATDFATFLDLGNYSAIRVFGDQLLADTSGQRMIQVSRDNGVTWDEAHYDIIDINGATTTVAANAIFPQAAATTAARSFMMILDMWNIPTIKGWDSAQRDRWVRYIEPSALSALRVFNGGNTGPVGNLTGGTIHLWGIPA